MSRYHATRLALFCETTCDGIAARPSDGNNFAHATSFIFGVGVHKRSVNSPAPVKPPHSGTLAQLGTVAVLCVKRRIHLLVAAHPHVTTALCCMLLARVESLGSLGKGDAVKDEPDMFCPPLGAMTAILVNKITPRCRRFLNQRLFLCNRTPKEAGRIKHTEDREAACLAGLAASP